MKIPIGTVEDWKNFIVEGNCECEDENLIELVDVMADRLDPKIFMCSVCHKEVLPCTYCGKVPCKCVEINNLVDEARGN